MSFRKRHTVIRTPGTPVPLRAEKALPSGTRPSPLDGRLTTSTGTASLDQLLAGHAGLPLGSSLLIEESGTTDFGGVLLRYFAGEGLVQGQLVHVLGVHDNWRRELPGLIEVREKPSVPTVDSYGPSKMKIAWRYENLGNQPNKREFDTSIQPEGIDNLKTFCHTFDLTQRLEASSIHGQLLAYPLYDSSSTQSPFSDFISNLRSKLTLVPTLVHRVVIPSLLSPALYSSTASRPQDVLQFLHSLRALLRQFPTQLTALVTLPLSLHPRSTGLCQWMELFFDGIVELVALQQPLKTGVSAAERDTAQGLVRVHTMPAFHEKGGGMEGCWKREEMSFRLSASSGLRIVPFSLPPVGLESSAPTASSKPSKTQDLEF